MPPLGTSDGRRGWAFLALVGGAITFTAFAAFGVYQLRNSAGFTFWLALAAHAQVFVVLASLGGLLVKRMIKITRDGAEYEDKSDTIQSGDQVKVTKK